MSQARDKTNTEHASLIAGRTVIPCIEHWRVFSHSSSTRCVRWRHAVDEEYSQVFPQPSFSVSVMKKLFLVFPGLTSFFGKFGVTPPLPFMTSLFQRLYANFDVSLE